MMNFNDYKQTCTEVLTDLPLELCAGQDIFTSGDWPEKELMQDLYGDEGGAAR
ncbi:MAG: hypothetical protein L0226_00950 [Acidobacteria bacterium]|nr:hypothetical protein [Acidobacteriota bacterium]